MFNNFNEIIIRPFADASTYMNTDIKPTLNTRCNIFEQTHHIFPDDKTVPLTSNMFYLY